jgi:hypothetical protein
VWSLEPGSQQPILGFGPEIKRRQSKRSRVGGLVLFTWKEQGEEGMLGQQACVTELARVPCQLTLQTSMGFIFSFSSLDLLPEENTKKRAEFLQVYSVGVGLSILHTKVVMSYLICFEKAWV